MTRRLRAAIVYVLMIAAVVALLLAAAIHGIDSRCHRDPGYPGCAQPHERTSTP